MRQDMGAHRDSTIRYDGERWRLHRMVADPAAVEQVREARLAAGRSFMPEDVVECQRPGPAVFETTSREKFIDYFCAMAWGTGPLALHEKAGRKLTVKRGDEPHGPLTADKPSSTILTYPTEFPP